MHHPMLKGINKMFTITLCQVTHKYSQRPISSRDYAFEFSPRTQRPEPATQMLCEGRRHREGADSHHLSACHTPSAGAGGVQEMSQKHARGPSV